MAPARTLETPAAREAARAVEIVTPSGLRLWHVEDYTVPLLSLDFAFLGGATQDPAGACGLTNLMAGLLDEGAGDMAGPDFHEALEEKAIELSFDAGRDRVDGSLRTLSENAARAFELLGLALCRPRFDEEAIARVKAQITAGLKRDESDPSARAREALYRLAFPGHPYGNPVEGRLGQLDGLTRAALCAHHGALLARSNLHLASVGAASAEEMIALVERAFAPLPAQAKLAEVPMAVPQGAGTRAIIDLDVPQSTLLMAMPGLLRADPDYMPAMVLNHILGGGSFTSRLWTEVREKRGLAYSVWSMLSPRRHTGLLMAGTATSNERTAESLQVILDEFRRMAEGGPTAEELDKARRYLVGSYALRFDTSRKIAGQLLDIQIEGLGIDYIDRRNGEIAAITLHDLIRAARRLLADLKPLVVVAGRPHNLEAHA